MMFAAIGSSLLLMILIYHASSKFSENGFLTNVRLVRNNNSYPKLILIPALVGLIFAGISATIMFVREKVPRTPIGDILLESQSSEIFLIFLFMAICVAPLVEEIVFRGYFFHVLKQLTGLRWAFVLIGASFALLHVGQYWGDWMAIVMITLVGFALTGLRAWSHSTVTSAVAHYAYNGAVTIIPIVMIMVNNPAYFEYQAHYQQLDFSKREALLLEALQADPDMADLYYELAILYGGVEGKRDEALVAIDKALRVYPQDHAFLEIKAGILEGLGRYRQALDIRNELLIKRSGKEIRQEQF
jgi:membrane protease YdiL (CAAX protease family)